MVLILGAFFLPPWLCFISAMSTERGLNAWVMLKRKREGEMPLFSPPNSSPFMTSLCAKCIDVCLLTELIHAQYFERQSHCSGVVYTSF